MSFLKGALSTVIGLVIFSFLVVFFFIGLIGIASSDKQYEVNKKSILHLNFNGSVVEQKNENPIDDLVNSDENESSMALMDLKNVIKKASTDDKIEGIYINITSFNGGMAVLEEVRTSLENFKNSGKFVYTYSNYMSEGAYYLASISDKIYLNPEGELEFNGLSATVSFFKGLFDKLGIEAQVFRVGEFKSAVEPFIRKNLSEENKLQLDEILNSINSTILENISSSRKLNLSTLADISKNMRIREAIDAKSFDLVDGLLYEDQVIDTLKNLIDVEKLKLVKYSDYKNSFDNQKSNKNKIAVIVASGDIVSGNGSDDNIGGEKFAKIFRKVREDKNIKAVVLRINSPGGSYNASDMIWREIMLTKEQKPVVASMSNYAASGGYYLAMACDSIIAQPNTITGSIGIFGIIFNIGDMLEDKFGITNETVQTGEFSNIFNMTRTLTSEERDIIQTNLNKKYDNFVTKASEGRKMKKEKLMSVASGRVWTGEQAVKKGLVDKLGTYDDAINIAQTLAGFESEEDYQLKFYPKPKSFFEKLSPFLENIKTELIKTELKKYYPYVKKLNEVKDLQGVQSKSFVHLEVK